MKAYFKKAPILFSLNDIDILFCSFFICYLFEIFHNVINKDFFSIRIKILPSKPEILESKSKFFF